VHPAHLRLPAAPLSSRLPNPELAPERLFHVKHSSLGDLGAPHSPAVACCSTIEPADQPGTRAAEIVSRETLLKATGVGATLSAEDAPGLREFT